MNGFDEIVRKIKVRWLVKLWLTIGILTLTLTLLSYLVIQYYSIQNSGVLLTLITFLVFSFLLYKSDFPSDQKVLSLIDHQIKDAEYSSFLIMSDPQSALEKIQQKKVLEKIRPLVKSISTPLNTNKVLYTVAVFILLTTASFFPAFFPQNSHDGLRQNTIPAIDSTINQTPDTIFLTSWTVYIVPPDYTGRSAKSISSGNFSVPENSKIKFDLEFNQLPAASWIKFSNGDSLVEDVFYRPTETGFYTIHYLDQHGKEVAGPYQQLTMVTDQPPIVKIEGIPQFQRFSFEENASFSFTTHIEDDYGIEEAFITATITKGSGEAIKFREQRINFNENISGKKVKLTQSFSVDQFDMEPGNELYFYVTAIDNKEPKSQYTKTETYFFIIEDTTDLEFTLEGNLGVDIMPDYFRSQLQIIMDTEKLLKEKTRKTSVEFNHESNELAFDQKQLRLKYGQFIGEESESGIVATREELPESDDESGSVLEEFGHDHDHENEEGQHLDRGTQHDHDHDHGHNEEQNRSTSTENDLLEEFVHTHEDRETATFYTQSLKSKLRAALNEMWDAELHLRLYQPEKSLPYQYKALKLIKEIRNHARIYVKRIGFDPPPINEDEYRLKKEVEEPYKEPFQAYSGKEVPLEATRTLIREISNLSGPETKNLLVSHFERSGKELARLAIENPGSYLSELNRLREFSNKSFLNENDIEALKILKARLIQLLPSTAALPRDRKSDDHPLIDNYIREITQ